MVEITFRAKNQTGVYGENKAYYYRIPVNYRIALPGMNETEKAGLHKVPLITYTTLSLLSVFSVAKTKENLLRWMLSSLYNHTERTGPEQTAVSATPTSWSLKS